MRCIEKGPEPQAILDFKALANEDWQPSYGGLGGVEKSALRTALAAEQLGLCCYCEGRLFEDAYHIEHFRPQSTFPDLELDYENLLASCQKEGVRGEPSHCGHAKGNWFDVALMLSPLDAGCEGRFDFRGDGSVTAKDPADTAATTTIEKLALDCSALQRMRAAHFSVLLDDDLDDGEYQLLREAMVLPLPDGRLNPYVSAVRSVFDLP